MRRNSSSPAPWTCSSILCILPRLEWFSRIVSRILQYTRKHTTYLPSQALSSSAAFWCTFLGISSSHYVSSTNCLTFGINKWFLYYYSRPESTRWDHILLDVLSSVDYEHTRVSFPNGAEAPGVQIITSHFSIAEWSLQVRSLHRMPVVDDQRGGSESTLERLRSSHAHSRHLFERIANSDWFPYAKNAGKCCWFHEQFVWRILAARERS